MGLDGSSEWFCWKQTLISVRRMVLIIAIMLPLYHKNLMLHLKYQSNILRASNWQRDLSFWWFWYPVVSYHAGATLIHTVSGSRGVEGSSELLATKPSSKRKISSFKSIFKISQSQTGYKLLLEKANSEFYYSTSSLFLQRKILFFMVVIL